MITEIRKDSSADHYLKENTHLNDLFKELGVDITDPRNRWFHEPHEKYPRKLAMRKFIKTSDSGYHLPVLAHYGFVRKPKYRKWCFCAFFVEFEVNGNFEGWGSEKFKNSDFNKINGCIEDIAQVLLELLTKWGLTYYKGNILDLCDDYLEFAE